LAALAGAALDNAYRDGGWTARQVVHHLTELIGSHPTFQVRFSSVLTHP